MSCGVVHRRGSDPKLLWLWHKLVATAPIRPLAWEPPYATRAAQEIATTTTKEKKTKKNSKNKINQPNKNLFFFFFFFFLWSHQRHMEVPRLGVESKLQLPAYTAAIAMKNLSHVYDLHHSSQQRWILDPLIEARDQTHVLMDASPVR